jgi:predicted TIM-barrel fold metal-dependent hydrolase
VPTASITPGYWTGSGRPATWRGIVAIDDATPDDVLESMHVLGVRGVRLNLVTGARPEVGKALARVQDTAARISDLGWHLQVFARSALLEGIATLVPKLAVPVVFDHMAGAHAALGLDQPGFKAVLRLTPSTKLANSALLANIANCGDILNTPTRFAPSGQTAGTWSKSS